MARPNPAQMAFRRSTDIIGLTGTRGNPDLLPFSAMQYDVGFEYYLSDVSYSPVASSARKFPVSSSIPRPRK